MGYGDDINLVLPVEEYDEVRKSSQHDATGSMQIVSKPARCIDVSLGVPDCRQVGLAAGCFVNP